MKGEIGVARVATASAALALAVAGLFRGNNPDTFGHLAQGRQIAELGRVPRHDTWSLLPGPRPWHNYEWLSDLGTYWLYAEFGYAAITCAKAVLLALAAVWLGRWAERIAGARAAVLTSLVLVTTLPAIRPRLSDRPHIVGICLAAAYLLLLTRLSEQAGGRTTRRSGWLALAALAALHVLWVNAHGSHLLGLLMTASFALFAPPGARSWLAAASALQLLSSCVSPYGPRIWLDALAHVFDARYRDLISEWQPWRESDPAWLQLGPALHGAVLTLLAPRLARHSPAVRAALPMAALLGLACFRSIRFLAEFMLLSAPLIGVGLASFSERLSARGFRLGAASSALWLSAIVPPACARLPPYLGVGLGMSFRELPQASGALLARYGASPRVFAAMQDAWFTMFAAPGARFVLDGRAPFYGPEYIARVSRAFADRRRFEQLIEALQVNVVIAGHSVRGERQLTTFMTREQGWSLALIEDAHATYVRVGALAPEGLRRYPPLTRLRPGYELGWILEADGAGAAQIRAELARLAALPGTGGYRAWVEGVLALAPLRRRGPSDGFRWPRDARDWEVYRSARPLIARAAQLAPYVPVVAALEAELAAISCDFPAAEAALERALREGPAREPLLAAQELALRTGHVDEVERVLRAARALPEGKDDPWLLELAHGLTQPPTCPAQGME